MSKKVIGAVTAYGIARKNGFNGTEKEWLESLRGPEGEVTSEQIKSTVKQYFQEYPIQTGISEEEMQSKIDEAVKQINEKIASLSFEGTITDEQIQNAIGKYLQENQINANAEQVRTEVEKYFQMNPIEKGLTEEQVNTKITTATTPISEELATQSREIEEVKNNKVISSLDTDPTSFSIASSENNEIGWYDLYKYPPLPTWGHEYLYGYYEKLLNGEDLKICMEGDSTTYEGFWNSGGERRTYVHKLFELAGYTGNVEIINSGYGSATSGHWVGTWTEDKLNELKNPPCSKTIYPNGTIDTDMAKNPDLIIWSYGINDASTNLYPNDTLEEKLNRFKNNLYEGLKRIRGNVSINGRPSYNKNADTLPIILCVPVTTHTPSLGKTYDLWTKHTRSIIQKACREFHCAFWDLSIRHFDHAFSNKWSISTSGTGYDGTHPRPACNADFVSSGEDLIIPRVFSNIIINNNSGESTTSSKELLNTNINQARSNLNSVSISADGTDIALEVSWVTQDVYDTYNSAITMAQTVYDESSSSEENYQLAISNLQNSTVVFNNAKRFGTYNESGEEEQANIISELSDIAKNINKETGELIDSQYSNGVTNYIPVKSTDSITVSAFSTSSSNGTVYLYDSSKNYLGYVCGSYTSISEAYSLNLDTTNKFAFNVKFSIPSKFSNAAYIRVISWKNAEIDESIHPFYVKIEN